MATIDTEDAARRLARVILSDIDLYMRERPKAGESREAQVEEGRRLFASRVTPELVPVFAMVLADRAAGNVNAPAVPAARPVAASDPAPDVEPVRSSAAPTPAIEDEPPTDPSIFVPPVEDQPLSVSAPVALPVAAALPAARVVTPRAPDPPPPVLGPPVFVRPVEDQRPSVPVPAAPPAAAALQPAPLVVPAAADPPPPILTARISIPRMLAIASVLAAMGAVLHRFLR